MVNAEQQGLWGTDYEKTIDEIAINGTPYSEIVAMIQRTPIPERDREDLQCIAARFTL